MEKYIISSVTSLGYFLDLQKKYYNVNNKYEVKIRKITKSNEKIQVCIDIISPSYDTLLQIVNSNLEWFNQNFTLVVKSDDFENELLVTRVYQNIIIIEWTFIETINYFDYIPLEMTYKIMSYLDLPNILFFLSSSRNIHTISNDSRLWMSIYEEKYKKIDKKIETIYDCFPYYRSVWSVGNNKLLGHKLLESLNKFQNITDLYPKGYMRAKSIEITMNDVHIINDEGNLLYIGRDTTKIPTRNVLNFEVLDGSKLYDKYSNYRGMEMTPKHEMHYVDQYGFLHSDDNMYKAPPHKIKKIIYLHQLYCLCENGDVYKLFRNQYIRINHNIKSMMGNGNAFINDIYLDKIQGKIYMITDHSILIYLWTDVINITKPYEVNRLIYIDRINIKYKIKNMVIGNGFFVILTEEGKIYGKGRNDLYQMGRAHTYLDNLTCLDFPQKIKNISGSNNYLTILTKSGDLYITGIFCHQLEGKSRISIRGRHYTTFKGFTLIDLPFKVNKVSTSINNIYLTGLIGK